MKTSRTMRRVVVTGMGAVTPVGLTVKEFWENILKGVSGVAPITQFDASDYDTKFAAELKNFNPLNYMDGKLAQRVDPFTQYALAATEEAVKNSSLDFTKTSQERAGVIVGSGIGGMWTYHHQQRSLWENNGDRKSVV